MMIAFKDVLSQNFNFIPWMIDSEAFTNWRTDSTGHLLFPNDESLQRDSAHSNPSVIQGLNRWTQKSLMKSNSWFPGDRSLLYITICMHSPPVDKESLSERCACINRRRGRSVKDKEFKRLKPNKQDNRFKYIYIYLDIYNVLTYLEVLKKLLYQKFGTYSIAGQRHAYKFA